MPPLGESHRGEESVRAVARVGPSRQLERQEHVGDLVGRVLAGAGDRRTAFLGFARSVDRKDLDQLREAIRQVERERRARR